MWTLQTRVSCVAIVKLRLGALHCNRVPAGCPLFSGLQTGSCSLSAACRIRLGALGETPSRIVGCLPPFENYHYALRSALTPPCGVPFSVGNHSFRSKAPDLSHARICRAMTGKVFNFLRSSPWLIRSKHFAMSASKTDFAFLLTDGYPVVKIRFSLYV